jgi:hypothetical protein
MDKGFNDDELADIMSEIESLEEEFASDDVETKTTDSIEEEDDFAMQEEGPVAPVVAKAPVVNEVKAQVDEQMHEVLDELSQMPVEDVVPTSKVVAQDDNIHHMRQVVQAPVKATSSGAHTSMSFKVEGEMQMDLSFCIGGQDVSLHITEQGFEIELAGGAKFILPLTHVKSSAKAA